MAGAHLALVRLCGQSFRMPEFFIPLANTDEVAEQTWHAVKKYMEDAHGWDNITDHRIFRLDYLHDGKHMEAEVGAPHPHGMRTDWEKFEEVGNPEPVFVIFESEGGPFLVCTPNRGVIRDTPILVGGGEPYKVTYFDGYEP